MNMDNEYIIEELLVRYCEGKVSEEEATYVKRWMKSSTENRRMAQRINRLCLAADTLDMEESIDTTRAFGKVRKRIAIHRLRLTGKWLQRIAALLFIPLLTLWLLQNYNSPTEAPTLVEIHTRPGMSSSFTLPDGTLVYLNSASSLTYPASFDGDVRNVSLKGEAYFEVSHDPKKKFIVSTPHDTRIEVLGTHFNLEAYEEEEKVLATLLEGKINFFFYNDNKMKRIDLSPGSKVIYNARTSAVKMYRTSGLSETGWTQGKIILENTPLEESLHLLGKHFHADFVIANPKLKEYSFTGIFANQSLERVLDKFRLSSRIRWRYLNTADDSEKKIRIEIY